MNMGFELIKALGAGTSLVRAGHSNMFLSPLFTEAFVNMTQAPLELYKTDSAEGVARAAAWGSDYYASRADVFRNLTRDRKSSRLNSSHVASSYAVFCLKKK